MDTKEILEETSSEETSEKTPTTFEEVYDIFSASVMDDMFMELTRQDTDEMMEEILMRALPEFEFPVEKNPLLTLDRKEKHFGCVLNFEEMNILAAYMVVKWIDFQLATVDLIRQKYSGSDFKFTSQASHIKQLKELKQQYIDRAFHLQRLYRRRSRLDEKGNFLSAYVDIIKPL